MHMHCSALQCTASLMPQVECQMLTLGSLFKHVKPGGWYEDTARGRCVVCCALDVALRRSKPG
jgi:hypothetical protein